MEYFKKLMVIFRIYVSNIDGILNWKDFYAVYRFKIVWNLSITNIIGKISLIKKELI